jgi:predicted DsbA family dithiol-disulfide isomerase
VDCRGFELHPETPVGGRSVRDFVGADRVEAMRDHLRAFAHNFGVDDMGAPERIPNTRRALALVEYARDHGALERTWSAGMDAYWRDGKDLEDDEVLHGIADHAGLDPDAAVRAVSQAATLARVDALRVEAHDNGVMGIPNVLIGDQRIVGCQDYERFAAAARAAGARPRNS